MPCDTIRQTSVDVGKMNIDILAAGLQAAGYTILRKDKESKVIQFKDQYGVNARYEEGMLRGNVEANAIKRAYSQQVVRQISNQFGWKLSTFNAQGKATATKRSY